MTLLLSDCYLVLNVGMIHHFNEECLIVLNIYEVYLYCMELFKHNTQT